MESKKHVVYELLGSPSLLYRHAPSYTLLHDHQHDPTIQPLQQWHNMLVHESRIKARFYDASHRLSERGIRRESKKVVVRDDKDPTNFNFETRKRFYWIGNDDIREKMFPPHEVKPKLWKRYDQPYDSAGFATSMSPYTRAYKEAQQTVASLAMERRNASAEYLAPFPRHTLRWAMKNTSVKRKKDIPPPPLTFTYGLPRDHGNCLASFLCPCCHITRCLLHPTGELLSSLCVSTIAHSNEPMPKLKRYFIPKIFQILDLGERILQITEASSWKDGTAYFVARSTSFTSLVRVMSVNKPTVREGCQFEIKRVNRIDLRCTARPRSGPSFHPRHVAAHPKYGGTVSLMNVPMVATIMTQVGHTKTNILHITGAAQSETFRHTILNLQNMELIEFSPSHPMVLHTAATSFVRPALVPNIVDQQHTLGHGSSLYSVDLRSNKATFQWSPSAEEILTEGVLSISGIVSDWTKEHSLFLASTAAGKLWEIDPRMPYKAINVWSVPGSSLNLGVNSDNGNLHGGGTMLHQPCDSYYQDGVLRPILSMDKTPGMFGLSIHQQPLIRPRLETASLEITRGAGLESARAVRSSLFPMPDIGKEIFTCGIASFRDKSTAMLSKEQLSDLEFRKTPSMGLTIITMTNVGDIYSHSLVECDDDETIQTAPLTNIPGARGILVDSVISEKITKKPWHSKMQGGYNLQIHLGDVAPVPNRQIQRTSVQTREDCTPFTDIAYSSLRETYDYIRTLPAKLGQESMEDEMSLHSRDADDATTSSSTPLETAMTKLEEDFDDDVTDSYRSQEDGGSKAQDLCMMANRLWNETYTSRRVQWEESDSMKEEESDSEKEEESDSVKSKESDSVKEEESDSVKEEESDSVKGEESDSMKSEESDSVKEEESDSVKGAESDSVKGEESDSMKGEESDR